MTHLGTSTKRVCVCTDDRDADDLFLFGLDWVTRQAVHSGINPWTAWSMGSLHPATRYSMDGEFGALGHSRRADVVLLNDALEVQNTWFGGELVVEDQKVTPSLDAQLSKKRYVYPKAAYTTVQLPESPKLLPALPESASTVHFIRTELPGIVTLHRQAEFNPAGVTDWGDFMAANDLCHLAVIERYGKSGEVAHTFLQNFGLKNGAVASSVGHDAHNVVVAGTSESAMDLAVESIRGSQGGVVVVQNGEIVAKVELPVAGLISDQRATEVAAATTILKEAWVAAGCTLPYMGFNLLPLSVIPEIRLTDKGLVKVPEMTIQPLFS